MIKDLWKALFIRRMSEATCKADREFEIKRLEDSAYEALDESAQCYLDAEDMREEAQRLLEEADKMTERAQMLVDMHNDKLELVRIFKDCDAIEKVNAAHDDRLHEQVNNAIKRAAKTGECPWE